MTIHQACRLALGVSLVLTGPTLFASEIVLFEGEYFQGYSIVFRDAVPNLDGTGFNDRTASISVRDGTWEVCFHADFQGGCMQLPPGDYPRLDPPFDRSISSVRPLWGTGYGGIYSAPVPSPQVSLGIWLPGVSIGINLPLYPELVPIPGYPVYYAPRVNSNYFFYDGMYWVYQQDNWYASSWYNGPWGLVAPEAVPLFVLRVPVRYYREPPRYFRGWRSDAPPRWGELWGSTWTQSHRGWDNWNRAAVPARAPLPAYQRQYSGDRYPAAAQQRELHSQNYRYQPQDAVVRQHFQTPQGAAPAPSGQPPQSGSREAQRPAPAPSAQRAAPVPRGQPAQSGSREAQRPAPAPSAQRAAPVPRGQPPQSGSRDVQRRAAPAPSPQGGPTAGQQRQQPGHAAPQPEQSAPKPQGQDKGPQGRGHAQDTKQGQTKDAEKGGQRGGELSR